MHIGTHKLPLSQASCPEKFKNPLKIKFQECPNLMKTSIVQRCPNLRMSAFHLSKVNQMSTWNSLRHSG